MTNSPEMRALDPAGLVKQLCDLHANLLARTQEHVSIVDGAELWKWAELVLAAASAIDRAKRQSAPHAQGDVVELDAFAVKHWPAGTPVKAPGRAEKGRVTDPGTSDTVFVAYPAGGGKFWRWSDLQLWDGYRDGLGRVVRQAWIKWAKTQPSPKEAWLVSYDGLSEIDKEADRQIGEALLTYLGPALSLPHSDGAVAGWKLVPTEPNNDMIVAGEKQRPGSVVRVRDVYRAMLAAAPVSPINPVPAGVGVTAKMMDAAIEAYEKVWPDQYSAIGLRKAVEAALRQAPDAEQGARE